MDSKDRKIAYKVVYDAYRDLYFQKKQEQYILKDKDNLSNIEKEELLNIKKSLIL
jgi:hypothetical protein